MKKSLSVLSLCALLALAGCGKQPTSEPKSEPKSEQQSVQPSVQPSETQSVQPSEQPSEAPVSTKLDVTKRFADSGQEVYTVEEKDGGVEVSFTKKAEAEWAHALVNLAEDDLSGMQCVRFTIAGSDKVKLKIESSAGGKEVDLKLTEAGGSYEWLLNGTEEQAILAGQNVKFIIFALPGAASGSGKFTLKGVEFDKEFSDEPQPIQSGYTNIRNDVNEYDGTAATFSFNKFWLENDANTYEEVDNQDGSVTLNYSVVSYQFAAANLAGAGYDKFEYITFKASGTEGHKVLLKVEPQGVAPTEITCTFTGAAEDVFVMDLSAYTQEQRASINRILVFAEPGAPELTKGSLTIKQAYYTMEDESPVVALPELNDGYGRVLELERSKFTALDQGIYTMEGNTLSWDENKPEWSFLVYDFGGKVAQDYTKLSYDLTLNDGATLLVKFEGSAPAQEFRVESGQGSIELDQNVSKWAKVVIAANPGTDNKAGSIVFNSFKFDGRTPATVADDGKIDLASGRMFDLGDKVYDVVKNNDGTYSVTNTAKGEWNCFGLRVTVPETAYTKATIVVSGDAADTLKCKVENDANGTQNKEEDINALGEHVSVEIDLTNPNSGNPTEYLFVFFTNFGTTRASTAPVVIESITLHN